MNYSVIVTKMKDGAGEISLKHSARFNSEEEATAAFEVKKTYFHARVTNAGEHGSSMGASKFFKLAEGSSKKGNLVTIEQATVGNDAGCTPPSPSM